MDDSQILKSSRELLVEQARKAVTHWEAVVAREPTNPLARRSLAAAHRILRDRVSRYSVVATPEDDILERLREVLRMHAEFLRAGASGVTRHGPVTVDTMRGALPGGDRTVLTIDGYTVDFRPDPPTLELRIMDPTVDAQASTLTFVTARFLEIVPTLELVLHGV